MYSANWTGMSMSGMNTRLQSVLTRQLLTAEVEQNDAKYLST